jgi:hypothetical protein
MKTIQKRFLLFLIGCIGMRTLFAFIANKINLEYLPHLGYLALIPAIGLTYIYITDSRQTGGEVFGEKIWWNDLRPVHALLYASFAYSAINKNQDSWKFLAWDAILGLGAFLFHHYNQGSFSQVFS